MIKKKSISDSIEHNARCLDALRNGKIVYDKSALFSNKDSMQLLKLIEILFIKENENMKIDSINEFIYFIEEQAKELPSSALELKNYNICEEQIIECARTLKFFSGFCIIEKSETSEKLLKSISIADALSSSIRYSMRNQEISNEDGMSFLKQYSKIIENIKLELEKLET